MKGTSIATFSHAAEQAQQWVNELADDLEWNERRAYRLLRSVLQAPRDSLSTEEMADLSAQLPVRIRGEISQVRNSMKKSLRQLWPSH